MTRIADGIYHFWHTNTSSMVVVGNDSVLVTDPAVTFRAEAMKAEIDKITDKPVKYVALSHEHYDHIGGTEVFGDAEIICHQACTSIFSLSPLLPTPQVDIAFKNLLLIDLGGKQVELVHIAVGDGVATTVMRVAEAGVVFSADLYAPRAFTVMEFKQDTNFVGVRQILNTIIDWNLTYAINGHSPGNSLTALKENAELYNQLYDIIIERFEQVIADGGVAAGFGLLFSLPNEIQLEAYRDWANYEAQFPAYVRRMALSIFHGG